MLVFPFINQLLNNVDVVLSFCRFLLGARVGPYINYY